MRSDHDRQRRGVELTGPALTNYLADHIHDLGRQVASLTEAPTNARTIGILMAQDKSTHLACALINRPKPQQIRGFYCGRYWD